MDKLYLLTLVAFLSTSTIQHQLVTVYSHQYALQSPCPRIFVYKRDWRSGQWTGQLTLALPVSVPVLKLDVVMYSQVTSRFAGTMRLKSYSVPNYFNSNSPQRFVFLEQIFPFPYDPPAIDKIYVNDDLVCTGPRVFQNKIRLKYRINLMGLVNAHTTAQTPLPTSSEPPVITETTAQTPLLTSSELPATIKPTAQQSDRERRDECGHTKKPNALVLKGNKTERGDWPWLVAIHTVVGFQCIGKMTFLCGGTLISTKLVVTAGHCMQDLSGKKMIKEDIYLELGKYDLTRPAEALNQRREIEEIKLHPLYDYAIMDNDIAVLVMDRPVTDCLFVRPICVWKPQMSDSEAQIGTVVGWGIDEQLVPVSNTPRMTNVTLVSREMCKKESSLRILDDTLCAGTMNESGPCNGDSGGGLMVFSTERNRWFLRGVISVSVSHDTKTCDLSDYVMYTDIAKYDEWLSSIM